MKKLKKIIADKDKVKSDSNRHTAITSLSNIAVKLEDYYHNNYSYDPKYVRHAIEAMENLTGNPVHMFLPKDNEPVPMLIIGDNGTEDPPVYIIAPLGVVQE